MDLLQNTKEAMGYIHLLQQKHKFASEEKMLAHIMADFRSKPYSASNRNPDFEERFFKKAIAEYFAAPNKDKFTKAEYQSVESKISLVHRSYMLFITSFVLKSPRLKTMRYPQFEKTTKTMMKRNHIPVDDQIFKESCLTVYSELHKNDR